MNFLDYFLQISRFYHFDWSRFNLILFMGKHEFQRKFWMNAKYYYKVKWMIFGPGNIVNIVVIEIIKWLAVVI